MKESIVVSTISDLVDELEKRYPNDVFVLETQENTAKYIAKIELIREIKKLGGLLDGITDTN